MPKFAWDALEKLYGTKGNHLLREMILQADGSTLLELRPRTLWLELICPDCPMIRDCRGLRYVHWTCVL